MKSHFTHCVGVDCVSSLPVACIFLLLQISVVLGCLKVSCGVAGGGGREGGRGLIHLFTIQTVFTI